MESKQNFVYVNIFTDEDKPIEMGNVLHYRTVVMVGPFDATIEALMWLRAMHTTLGDDERNQDRVGGHVFQDDVPRMAIEPSDEVVRMLQNMLEKQ